MQGHQVLEVHTQYRQPEASTAGPGAAVAGVVVVGGEEFRQLQQGLCGKCVLGIRMSLLNMPLAKHLSSEEEKRKHKKLLVQSPNPYFRDVKCPGCYHTTMVFSHIQNGSLVCWLLRGPLSAHGWKSAAERKMLLQEEAALKSTLIQAEWEPSRQTRLEIYIYISLFIPFVHSGPQKSAPDARVSSCLESTSEGPGHCSAYRWPRKKE